ncbi:BNR repeat-containing protein [Cellulomonas shaoxiangyii]|uniref:Uncharacterized protein n=1 Tax=Cellulomonas shaoxiangyii TaxID=2566013 RepID=A0A4P7SI52_9CELL|nr:BNR repeat-containing protein [Cellulomonas shaoxiangyii]QCB93288.1 hypothetical protein E5225_06725 [Cellulomonas shaoxiangyii]TGY82492.1 hypothetical protein E5226_13225 [Cellulomonas shaoxiangyii]
MAYPPYVLTRAVSVGGAMTVEAAKSLRISLKVTSTRSLVWDETGYRFESEPAEVLSEPGTEATVVLPRTDVPGWRDGRTGALIDVSAPGSHTHTYRALLSFRDADGRTLGIPPVEVGPFVLPGGDGSTLDLDKTVPVGTVSGQVVSIPDSWSAIVAAAQKAAEDAAAALAGATTVAAEALTLARAAAPRAARPLVDIHPLPGTLWGATTQNSVSWGMDNVTTAPDGTQYAAWWSGGTRPHAIIGKRVRDEWQTFDLTTLAGDPLGFTVDLHNGLDIGVDAAGFVHLVGNVHSAPIRYVRSAAPGDITAWTVEVMVGDETEVSYPSFFKVDGALLFGFRQGGSGSGDYVLNRWGGAAWTRVAKVIDGAASGQSPYVNHVAVERAGGAHPGRMHLTWCWRRTSAVNTNHDICYAYSDDAGVTWRRSDDSAYVGPITLDTSEVGVAIPENGGLLNSMGCEVDAAGRVHTAAFRYDANGYTQIHHVWLDDTGWHSEQVTDLTYRLEMTGSTVQGTLGNTSVVTTASGRTYLIWRYRREGRRGSLRMIDLTPGDDLYGTDFAIAELELGDARPSFDTQALYERDELRILLCPGKSNGQAEEFLDDRLWYHVWGAVLVIDLSRIGLLEQGAARLPRMTTIASRGGFATENITATTPTTIGQDQSLPLIPTMLDSQVRMLLVRAFVRYSRPGGTVATIGLRQVNETTGETIDRDLTAASSGTTMRPRYGPWRPVEVYDDNTPEAVGYIQLVGSVDTGTATVGRRSLDLGAIII